MLLAILITISIFLFYRIVILKTSKEQKRKKMMNDFQKYIKEAATETALINSSEEPTDSDIELYYKMYLKKWELDHANEWTTDNLQPINFETWKQKAKDINSGGYRFIISKTMDYFIGFPPNMNMGRYRDYKTMVENETEKK